MVAPAVWGYCLVGALALKWAGHWAGQVPEVRLMLIEATALGYFEVDCF